MGFGPKDELMGRFAAANFLQRDTRNFPIVGRSCKGILIGVCSYSGRIGIFALGLTNKA